MLEFLIRLLADQTGWYSGLTAQIRAKCEASICRLREIRQNLFIALCFWALGFILVAISLASFAAVLVVAWWQDYPLQSLLVVSIAYAGAGGFFIRNSIRRIC